MSARLASVEDIVFDVADRQMTHTEALALLRKRGLNPWAQVLADAVAFLVIRDGLLDGSLDPYAVLSLEPRLYSGDIKAYAVDKYDADLRWCLEQLARKPVELVAAL